MALTLWIPHISELAVSKQVQVLLIINLKNNPVGSPDCVVSLY